MTLIQCLLAVIVCWRVGDAIGAVTLAYQRQRPHCGLAKRVWYAVRLAYTGKRCDQP